MGRFIGVYFELEIGCVHFTRVASLQGSTLLMLKQFTDFLAHRGQILETTCRGAVAPYNRPSTRLQSQSKRQALHATSSKGRCTYCNGDHLIYSCQKFLALQVNQRINAFGNAQAKTLSQLSSRF